MGKGEYNFFPSVITFDVSLECEPHPTLAIRPRRVPTCCFLAWLLGLEFQDDG